MKRRGLLLVSALILTACGGAEVEPMDQSNQADQPIEAPIDVLPTEEEPTTAESAAESAAEDEGETTATGETTDPEVEAPATESAEVEDPDVSNIGELPAKSPVTMSTYDRLETGMTLDEVISIMGREGRLEEQDEDSVRYVWQDEEYGPLIALTFTNGVLRAKAGANLP